MNWTLAFGISVTHLITKRKQTLVAMMGVMFGISMFIVMISFMTGVNRFMEDVAMDGSPHVRIYNPVQVKDETILSGTDNHKSAWLVVHHQRPKNDLPKIKNAFMIAGKIEKLGAVKGVAPQVSSQVFFNNGPIQVSGTMSGIDVRKQKEFFNLESKMQSGNLDDLLRSADAIIVGRGLAKKMNVEAGDRVSITTPQGNTLVLRVAGTFAYGLSQFDDAKSFASIATVQKILMRDPSYITDLHIKLNDYTRAKPVAKEIREQFKIFTEDWETANSSLLATNKIRNAMTGIVSFTLLLVAGFGIYNIMNMNIVNKMKDIAILKATGFEGNDIVGIFLLQSVMIGFTGGLLGILLGYGCCSLLAITPFPEGEFFRMRTMPVNFDVKFYILGLLFGFVTTLLAGYFPALKAARVDPVKIIRG